MGRARVPVSEVLTRYEPVSESGCWLWAGGWNPNGYGHISFDRKNWTAHRFFYTHLVGEIPGDREVCHKCDTRACVNPDHLFIETRSFNSVDMFKKGRGKSGERSDWAKITKGEAQEIRDLKGVMSQEKIGRHYGITQSAVSLIHRGLNWRFD